MLYKYRALREHIKSGDVVLWKGRSLISKIIQWWTPFSHASLVVRLDEIGPLKDRIFIIESLPGSGLSLRLLSRRLDEYSGDAYIFSLSRTSDKQRQAVRNFAIEEMAKGISYDFEGLIENIFGRVSTDASHYFCSEFVFDALNHGGIKTIEYHKKAPRPGDIPNWYDGVLLKIGE